MTRALVVLVLVVLLRGPGGSTATAAPWVFRLHEHSLAKAGPEPFSVATYTLVLGGGGFATLAVDTQRGRTDGTWRPEHTTRYAGPWTRGDGGTAIGLRTDDDAVPEDQRSLALACRPATPATAAATAARVPLASEQDLGQWTSRSTASVATLACTVAGGPFALTFGAGAGLERVFVTSMGNGLRRIPPTDRSYPRCQLRRDDDASHTPIDAALAVELGARRGPHRRRPA